MLKRSTSGATINATEWATFSHLKEAVFTDFGIVKQEIELETDRITGRNKVSKILFHFKLEILSVKIVPHVSASLWISGNICITN